MAHQHGTRCYWDVETCGWICRPEQPAERPERRDADVAPEPVEEREPVATAR